MTGRAAILACLALSSAACRPDDDDRASLVTAPRVLAVRAIPAEAPPKDAVAFEALFVGPEGPLPGERLDWAFCLERKPLTDQGTLSTSCLAPAGPHLSALGHGATVSGAVPEDACRLFGPDRPEPKAGEPAGRPTDPDPSGGYHQPVRIRIDPEQAYVSGSVRLGCGLSTATQEQSAEFVRRYRVNENPAPAALWLARANGERVEAPEDDTPIELGRGEPVGLEVTWSDCPLAARCGDGVCGMDEDVEGCREDCEAPRGCAGAEPYLYYDPVARALVERREAMLVSWFATAGHFEHDRTGRTEDEAGSAASANTWTAPSAPGTANLWVVLRDDRGGVGWRSLRVTVK